MNILWKVFLGIVQRVGFLYLMLGFFIIFLINVPEVFQTSRLKVLNRLRPETLDFLVDPVQFSQKYSLSDNEIQQRTEQYAFYYKKVAQYMPSRADAQGLAGYCAMLLGKEDEAIRFYEKSVANSGLFFWSHYNLAVLYFNRGEYSKVIPLLNKVMAVSPQGSVQFIKKSIRIYLPVVIKQGLNNEGLILRQIQDGHKRAYQLLALSYYYLKQYQDMFKVSLTAVKMQTDFDELFLFYAGVAGFELKKYRQSIGFLQAALKKDEGFAQAYEYLGKNLKVLNRQTTANVMLNKSEFYKRRGNSQSPFIEKSLLEIY